MSDKIITCLDTSLVLLERGPGWKLHDGLNQRFHNTLNRIRNANSVDEAAHAFFSHAAERKRDFLGKNQSEGRQEIFQQLARYRGGLALYKIQHPTMTREERNFFREYDQPARDGKVEVVRFALYTLGGGNPLSFWKKTGYYTHE